MICGKKGQRFPWLFVCLAIGAVEGRKHPSAGPMGPTSAGATDKSEKQRGRRQDHVQGGRVSIKDIRVFWTLSKATNTNLHNEFE